MFNYPGCPPVNEKICLRAWGSDILELGAFSKIGNYDIYQVWYFRKSGQIEAKTWSRRWNANLTHRHHPYWRLDFDIEGAGNQVWQYINTPAGTIWEAYQTEREGFLIGTGGWWIQNTSGTKYVLVHPLNSGLPDLFVPHNVAVRKYRGSEDVGWQWGASAQLPFNNGEQLWNQDHVFWWIGHLAHNWDGVTDTLGTAWHGVGLFIDVKW